MMDSDISDMEDSPKLLRLAHEIMSAPQNPPCYLSPNVEDVSRADEESVCLTDVGTPLATWIEATGDAAICDVGAMR